MSRPRRRVRNDLVNPGECGPGALALLPGLHFLHAHLHWTLGSVCWLGMAMRTGAAMTGVADSAEPAAPAEARPSCVVIDFPRARSKRLAQ